MQNRRVALIPAYQPNSDMAQLVQEIIRATTKRRPRETEVKDVFLMSHKVYITNKQNTVKVPSGLRILIRRSCHAVLEAEHFEGPAEISVTFVDNAEIQQLNKQYRDKDQATDVLSFPLGQDGKYDINQETGGRDAGDIVISMERAMEQANIYGHSLQREGDIQRHIAEAGELWRHKGVEQRRGKAVFHLQHGWPPRDGGLLSEMACWIPAFDTGRGGGRYFPLIST